MIGDPLYEPLGQDKTSRRPDKERWRKLATIAVAGLAIALVGAVEVLNPDRPRAVVVAVAPIEPVSPREAAPPGSAPRPPAANELAPSIADVAETGAADVSMENGVKVIRLNPSRRTEGDVNVSHGASGPGFRAVAPPASSAR